MKWLAPKRDPKKLVSFLLSTGMHMILCSRAKQPILDLVLAPSSMPNVEQTSIRSSS